MRSLLACLVLFCCAAAEAHDAKHRAAPRMAAAAGNLIATLSPRQRAQALHPIDGEERFLWHFIPDAFMKEMAKRDRNGLALLDMAPHQKALAAALLSAGLSQAGFIKVTTIMSLEDVLRLMENRPDGQVRNPELYRFSIFGEPSEKTPWAYRVEGHHVSLHFTVVGDQVASGPAFLGSNPAEVREGSRAGLRVLGAEEDKGRALLLSLTPAQRKLAMVRETAPSDILTGASRKAALRGEPNGFDCSKLNAQQRKLLETLLDEYVDNVPAELAELRRKRIRDSRGIWFAWAGPAEKGKAHYYRLQSAQFLIEYDNSQNNANHVHTVWRDFEDDFGVDLLRRHYATATAAHGHAR